MDSKRLILKSSRNTPNSNRPSDSSSKNDSKSFGPEFGVTTQRFYIKTLGCQMNENDSTMISEMFSDKGYIQTKEINEAQLFVLNTCSVRKSAEEKALSNIGIFKKIKEKKPNSIIIVVGCMAQRMADELKKRFPYVDIVLGSKDIFNLPAVFKDFISSAGIGEIDSDTLKKNPVSADIKYNKDLLKACVTIMRGCSNFCSYCIVPYVRGKEQSRPLSEIISEIKKLAQQGYQEITLLGQNVNSYCGKEYTHGGDEYNFSELLERVNEIENIKRLRFMTSHPKDMTDDIIFAVRDLDKVCEHIHLPVQSGSTKILNKMNRGYTSEDYIKLSLKIRKTIPDVSISTDIIVGYPGETEEDFKQTLKLVKEVSFDAAYTFKYSPRPGTNAAAEEDSVPAKEKESRLAELMDLCKKVSKEQNSPLVGRTEEILVERLNKNDSDKVLGRTRSNKIVISNGGKELIGKLIKVKITQAHNYFLLGEKI